MKKRIFSALMSVVIILSAFIIVPMTREVEAEAAYDARYSMYQSMENVFLPSRHERNGVANATTWALNDSTTQSTKLTVSAASADPYIGFEVSTKMSSGTLNLQASSDYSVSTHLVIVAKFSSSSSSDPAFNVYPYFNWNGPYGFVTIKYKSGCGNTYVEGGYNYYVLNFTGYYAGYNGQNITGLRYDFFEGHTAAAGDYVELDSFAFFTGSYSDSVEAANAYGAERVAVRNKTSDTYTITPNAFNAANAFSGSHNVNVSYTSSYGGAFKLTTATTCTHAINSSNGLSASTCSSKYACWDYDKYNAAFATDGQYAMYRTVLDPYVNLNCNVDTSKYKYAVIMYMTDFNFNNTDLGGVGFASSLTTLYDARNEGTNYTSIQPIFNSGTSAASYGITYKHNLYGVNELVYQIVDLSAASGTSLTGFRIDPFDYTFTRIDRTIYLKGITFAASYSEADAAAQSALQSTGMYSYQLSYNGNASGVSNLPGASKIVTIPYATYTTTVSSTTPSATNQIFDGWSYNGTTYQPGGEITISGTVNSLTTATLTGKWHYPYATLSLSATNSSDNIDLNQTYLFRISGTGLDPAIGEFNITIPLTTGQAMNFSLPYGTYTITCVDGWSWRYGIENLTRTVTINTENQTYSQVFSFTEGENESWMNKYYNEDIS